MKCIFVPICLLSIAVVVSAQVLDGTKIKNQNVKYVAPDRLRQYPTPVLIYIHDGKEHESLKGEIVERIIYPFLGESRQPIAAIVVDFCPEIKILGAPSEVGCKYENKIAIHVRIKRQDGSGYWALIEKSKNGRFDKDAFLKLLPKKAGAMDDYQPSNPPPTKKPRGRTKPAKP